MKNIRNFENLNKSEVKKAIRYFEKKHPETEVIASGWATHPQNECDKDTGFQTVSVELWSEAERESYTVYISVCLWDRRRSFIMDGAEDWYSEPETNTNTNNENEKESNTMKQYYITSNVNDRNATAKSLANGEKFDIWFTSSTVRHYDENGDLISTESGTMDWDEVERIDPTEEKAVYVGFNFGSYVYLTVTIHDGLTLDECVCLRGHGDIDTYRTDSGEWVKCEADYEETLKKLNELRNRKDEEPEEDTRSDAQKYADGIAEDLRKLYEANPTDEEREEAEENGEACDIWSYVSDCLDVEYTMDSNGEYIGARIYVTLGGPNAWIDTRDRAVRCAWGTDKAEAWLPSEICDEIDDLFSEQFACLRS